MTYRIKVLKSYVLKEKSRINLSQNNSLDYFARQSGMTLGLKLQDYAIHLLT